MQSHQRWGFGKEGVFPASSRGFSLMQVVVALVILGLLGSLTVSKWTKSTRKQALIGEGRSLRAVFQEARAYGVKKNVQVGLRFDTAGQSLRLFEDRDLDGALDSGEEVKVMKLGKGIRIGLPAAGPGSGPGNIAAPSSGLSGSWAQAWTASLDLSAAPAAGAVYLSHDLLPTYTLCLYGTAGSQPSLAAWWDGTSWNPL
jgi:type II secretory pathway pseudopilin PulG